MAAMFTPSERKSLLFGNTFTDNMNQKSIKQIAAKIREKRIEEGAKEKIIFELVVGILGTDLTKLLLSWYGDRLVWDPREKLLTQLQSNVIVYFGEPGPAGEIRYGWNFFSFFSLGRYFQRKAAITSARSRQNAWLSLAWQCEDPQLYDARMVIVMDFISGNFDDPIFDPSLPYVNWDGTKVLLPIEDRSDDDLDLSMNYSSDSEDNDEPDVNNPNDYPHCVHNVATFLCPDCYPAGFQTPPRYCPHGNQKLFCVSCTRDTMFHE